MTKVNLNEIEKTTQDVYEKYAKVYDRERNKDLFEKNYLDKFIRHLPNDSTVLDLGCGGGEPIARYLIDQGCKLSGADYSLSMLEICRRKFPGYTWFQADMRKLILPQQYDGIVSWGAFFHLNQQQQRDCLPKLCDQLKKSGILMVTVGHEAGEVTGEVAGQSVYHSSLAKEEYIDILESHSMKILEFNLQDPNCHGFSVLIAKK